MMGYSSDAGKHEGEKQPESFEELKRLLREKAQNGRAVERFNDWELMENLRFTNALYNRTVPGEPGSHRRLLGWLFRLAKRTVIWMLGWYINPMVENQHDFNAYATRTINEMKSYLDHLQVNEDILNTGIKRDIALFRTNLMFLNKELERRMSQFEKDVGAVAAGRTAAAVAEPDGLVLKGRPRDFERSLGILTIMQLVYGSPRELRARQKVYLQYFSGVSDVVVVGCGRGELLQLLADQGIAARGVEANEVLAEYCREHELAVTAADPLEYLASLEDASLDAAMVTRLTAHYTPARLAAMLRLCAEKLRDNGVMVIEAPSPFPVYAVNNGPPDGSEWAHPLSPQVLKFVCLASGFREPEMIALGSVKPDERIEEIAVRAGEAGLEPWQLDALNTINSNFQHIAAALSRYGDYALAMRRSTRGQDARQMPAALGDSV